MSLVEAYWGSAVPTSVAWLLDEVAGCRSGCAEFTFRRFDVLLDFEVRTATATDVLSPADSESTSLGLSVAIANCALAAKEVTTGGEH